jgi:hypothetical protein
MVDGYVPPHYLLLDRRGVDNSPFGSASEDFTKFETILLVGGRYQPHIKVWLTGSWDRRNPIRINPEINLVSLDNLLPNVLPSKCYMRKGTDRQV